VQLFFWRFAYGCEISSIIHADMRRIHVLFAAGRTIKRSI
jgi:hypothetical protein